MPRLAQAASSTVNQTPTSESIDEGPYGNEVTTFPSIQRSMKEFQSMAQSRRKALTQQASGVRQDNQSAFVTHTPTFTPKPSTPGAPLTSFTDADNVDSTIRIMLPILRAQSPHYITIYIHEKPYLVTIGDSIRLPFLMHGVQPGDTLRLNRATLLGSRDYTLKAGAWTKSKEDAARGLVPQRKWIDERLFTCRARVLGVEKEPMRIKEKTKRRQRHTKHVRSQHSYTILRISELEVHDIESLSSKQVAQTPVFLG